MENFMKNKSTKNKGGITLIALVITIIVLLILAAISITMLTGENSILKRTVDSKTKNDEAQIRERIQLAYHSALVGGKGSYTKDTLMDELKKEFSTDYDVNDSDNVNWKMIAHGQEVIIPAGKVPVLSSLASEIFDTSGTVKEKMHVGDYVKYPVFYDNIPIYFEGHTYVPKTEYNGWRVMSVEGEGDEMHIKLVSAGIPLSSSVTKGANATSNFSTKFFQTEISSSGLNCISECGFKTSQTDENHITSISSLKEIFNNKYTMTSADNPIVRGMNKNDIQKIMGKTIKNGDYVTSSDLCAIPNTNANNFCFYYLMTPSPVDYNHCVWYCEYAGKVYNDHNSYTFGVRCTVELKSDVKYYLSPESQTTDSVKIWNIE